MPNFFVWVYNVKQLINETGGQMFVSCGTPGSTEEKLVSVLTEAYRDYCVRTENYIFAGIAHSSLSSLNDCVEL